MRTPLSMLLAILILLVGGDAAAKESLLIGPGDLLHVQVFDTPELEQHSRIDDAGDLQLIMGGSVKLTGLTPASAARVIERALLDGHFLLLPRVLINVEEYATQTVTVFGQVHSPGAYEIDTPRQILDVLALAGGLTELADRRVIITRNESMTQLSYFVSNDQKASGEAPVTVNPGDRVEVLKAGIVYILGDVRIPGGYTMTNNESTLTALQLVARAGGTNNTAVPSHAKLIRKTSDSFNESPLPLSAMQKGRSGDVRLLPGDIIYVPFSYLRSFAVTGASSIPSAVASAAVYRF